METNISEAKRAWREKAALILREILKRNQYSQAVVDYKEGELFMDTCNFVNLHHEITAFIRTLENLNKFDILYELGKEA